MDLVLLRPPKTHLRYKKCLEHIDDVKALIATRPWLLTSMTCLVQAEFITK